VTASRFGLVMRNPRGHLAARSEAELAQNVFDVHLNGALANHQAPGDRDLRVVPSATGPAPVVSGIPAMAAQSVPARSRTPAAGHGVRDGPTGATSSLTDSRLHQYLRCTDPAAELDLPGVLSAGAKNPLPRHAKQDLGSRDVKNGSGG